VAPKYDWQTDRTMTAKQYRAAIGELGMNIAQSARYLGVGERTGHRYVRGETNIPEAHALLLRSLLATGTKPLVPEWISDRLVHRKA